MLAQELTEGLVFWEYNQVVSEQKEGGDCTSLSEVFGNYNAFAGS